MNLGDMYEERARLDAAIRAAEKQEHESWNLALGDCQDALVAWLRYRMIEVERRVRKNEETWDIGHGALVVTFGEDGTQWARSLRMVSGKTLTLEWSEVPQPNRLVAVAAALLGMPVTLAEEK